MKTATARLDVQNQTDAAGDLSKTDYRRGSPNKWINEEIEKYADTE